MKFLDLFAGIGGFRLGMEAAGHECVGYVEIDKYARQSYQAIHNTKGNGQQMMSQKLQMKSGNSSKEKSNVSAQDFHALKLGL